MSDINILLKPFDRTSLVALYEEMIEHRLLSIGDIKRAIARRSQTTTPFNYSNTLQLQIWLDSITAGDYEALIHFIKDLWQQKKYRRSFELLMDIAEQFTTKWQAPDDDDWVDYCHEWPDEFPEEIEDYGIFVSHIDTLLATAILLAELKASEQQVVQQNVMNFDSPMNCLNEEALEYLEGCDPYELEQTKLVVNHYWQLDLEKIGSDNKGVLINLYLAVYTLREQWQDYLKLTKNNDLWCEHLVCLTQLGEVSQVMTLYKEKLTDHSQYLKLIQALFEKYRAQAIQIAATALDLKTASNPVNYVNYNSLELYTWLSENAEPTLDHEKILCLKATDLAMEISPSLALYIRRDSCTSKDQWPTIRADYLERCKTTYKCIDVFIYSKEYDMACTHLKNSHYSEGDKAFIAALDVLKIKRPDWVKRYCLEQAEEIISQTKVNYYPKAVIYLKHVKEVYLKNNQSLEWQILLKKIISKNKRKIRLVPLLEKLNCN